jgi:type IV secretory pathway VirB2 component (pilin)
MKARVLLVLLALLPLYAFPAHASGGGTTLAFNDTLTTLQENLTGPTATTVCAILVVAGLISVAVGKDNNMMKTIGVLAITVACIAKAPTLMTQLGLGGATGRPNTWGWSACLLLAAWASFCLAATRWLAVAVPASRSRD